MRTPALLALLGLFSPFAIAQSWDIPLTNWTVPPYRGTTPAGGGLSTMTDVTPGIGFVGVVPCRLVDTRQAGFPAGYGTPALSPGVPRNFDLNSDPLCTGIPTGVEAYSLNVTVTNTTGPGHLVIYSQGGAQPTVSSINYVAGQTIANAVIVPAEGTGGGVTVIAGVSGTDLIIDINGYFTDQYNNNGRFTIEGSVFGTGILLVTNSSSEDFSDAILAQATASSGRTRGVLGLTVSNSGNAAGIEGRAGSPNGSDCCPKAGVRGLSNDGWGVVGISANAGAVGRLQHPTTGVLLTSGFLGWVAGVDPTGGMAPWGVFAAGRLGASGTKHFLDPHPMDPSKMISYISLEGPEAGTYFRGRGRFRNGLAVIPVPEDFRLVTDPEGLTVQITPIGRMATVGVAKIDLNEIVVEASRNVEFSYLVQGVRANFKDAQPIVSNREFMPESPGQMIPGWLSERQKQVLISNGTYNADGTANLETAHRLGWDKEWEKRKNPAPQAAAD